MEPEQQTPLSGKPSRAELISRGALVEVHPNAARTAGFKLPVAITRDIWNEYVLWGAQDNKGIHLKQDQRLIHLLDEASDAARRIRHTDSANFKIAAVPRSGDSRALHRVPLVIHISRGEEPAITIHHQQDRTISGHSVRTLPKPDAMGSTVVWTDEPR